MEHANGLRHVAVTVLFRTEIIFPSASWKVQLKPPFVNPTTMPVKEGVLPTAYAETELLGTLVDTIAPDGSLTRAISPVM